MSGSVSLTGAAPSSATGRPEWCPVESGLPAHKSCSPRSAPRSDPHTVYTARGWSTQSGPDPSSGMNRQGTQNSFQSTYGNSNITHCYSGNDVKAVFDRPQNGQSIIFTQSLGMARWFLHTEESSCCQIWSTLENFSLAVLWLQMLYKADS